MSKIMKACGVNILAKTKSGILDNFESLCNGKQGYICKVNSEYLVNACKDSNFRDILNGSSLNTADGIGVLWAAKYLALPSSNPPFLRQLRAVWQAIYSLMAILFYPRYIKSVIPERVGGVDLMLDMLKICTKEHKKVFLLGGQNGVPQKVKEVVEKEIEGLEIVGCFDGDSDDAGIAEIINKSKAEILFVAFGSPKQELWIIKNLPHLHHISLAIGEGGSFDFVAGVQKRAPKMLQKIGLEWLWRLIREPMRITRIINAVPRLIVTTVKYKLEILKANK
ncbi:TPA: hypothetical protein DDW69_00900 [candidate division CPR2 bacterium]|uniref:Teichoic acid biosynthesis protein n=1 Tax=candidate division CPR2 bacterium GW2011_GWC1_41_48 TaxID=1618344 RepID=A0A0G0Z9B6_UNCC2|nr:MAG: Glycosyl transferase, WecB/TagA/CpsF family [candidate division CPR2 bacterium GW2011_GWC2_39_35]KKR27842.1 MAG: Glycosyl transferase, WecB/TagA/CpsF family [candidate division CPR2 bacterium GW2011_GWD1_39_7]KKR28740.1 MAG: Glycosyl transferase, WecB/TagA/CpsF family [candidate division CPR2 bacterium GW2011_GWD2_39_7]KKS09603.1 MAG: Teichoic acid biosynthesis protein [candidate division CPR2 bacterium GW2011_GWC1_41_48]OGB59967.1 MAG: hypothetical protein A2Y27_00270 [candidate divisi